MILNDRFQQRTDFDNGRNINVRPTDYIFPTKVVNDLELYHEKSLSDELFHRH